MNTTRTRIAVRYAAAFLLALFFMGSAVWFSREHITEFATMLGLTGHERQFAYVYVDGFVALGLLLRSPNHSTALNRFGTGLMAGGGLISLVANVGAAGNAGEVIFGVMTVAVAVVSERAVAILGGNRPTVAVEPTPAELEHAKRSAAARKGAVTKAAKKAATPAPTPRRRRSGKPANAPVSPAPADVLASVKQLTEIVG